MRIVPLVLALVVSAPGLAAPVNTETIFGNPVSEGARHMNMSPSGFVDTGVPRVLFVQADTAFREGRYADAARILDGIGITFDAATNRLAALSHAGAGNLVAAERYFARALEADPRDARAQGGLGLVQLKLGKRAEAAALLRTLVTRQKRCASACERADEIDRATEVLARALG